MTKRGKTYLSDTFDIWSSKIDFNNARNWLIFDRKEAEDIFFQI